MSVLYFIALGAVCAAVLGVMAEAVLSVSRKPRWALSSALTHHSTAERRRHPLPYVGLERRRAAVPEPVDVVDLGVRERQKRA